MKFSAILFIAYLPFASAVFGGPVSELIVNSINRVASFFAGIDGHKADDYLGNLAQTVCGATFELLGISGLDCSCSSSIADDGSNSAFGSISCTTDERCLDNGVFCGSGVIDGQIQAGEYGIGLESTTCIAIDAGILPDPIADKDDYEVCVNTSSEPGSWGFDWCSATIRDEYCECTVCDGFGVMFDCSGINISPTPDLLPILGPKLSVCSFLDFSPKPDNGYKYGSKDKGSKDKGSRDKGSKDKYHLV